ncbi:hypothetical protein ZWY2020_001619 [Hordeum vulgare]|nr:hypothetical protein ZWY2020_001619 [Hordeum vulgare]
MAAASRAAAAEAAIGAMIDDHAAGSRKRRRIRAAEDYELSRVLGAGGFGVVIKAQHRATGEDVALKFLVCSTDGGGGGKRERHRAHALHHDLLREACYLAACRGHPSVVGLQGIARDPGTGQCSLVLEHLGPSLAHVLHARRRPFTEEDIRVKHGLEFSSASPRRTSTGNRLG